MPSNHWNTEFMESGDMTKVTITMTFASAEDIEKTIASGFAESLSMGFRNLDDILAKEQ